MKPVLVIHGVGNRDPEEFAERVRLVAERLGGSRNLIPVFWGDIGARTAYLEDTLPRAVRDPRSALPADAGVAPDVVRPPAAPRDAAAEAERREYLVQAALAALSDGAHRSARRAAPAAAVREALAEEWAASRYVRHVEDPETLRAVGRAVGDCVREYAEEASDAGLEATAGGEATAVDNVKRFARAMFRGLDAMAGAPVGLVAGAFNQHLRRKHAQGITGFLGDVFVYQRNHKAIHRRVMETLAERAPGYGTRERPISVLAHSLGGVIAFDLATRPIEPLWVDTLVTFGSQPSFFHVFDPRPGLDPYAPGSPVRLPETVRQWVNLWEPLDPLAFAAGRVFVLDSGLPPKDVHTPHAASFGLWTHDDYWSSTRLTDTIRDVLDA